MNRTSFLKSMTMLPFAAGILKLSELEKWASSQELSEKMPVLFLGHGSPMNAIEENEFVVGFRAIGKTIPKPKAILCISAHWETKGTYVTAMDHPRTIHDFAGFPKALFEQQYPAPGSPELALETKKLVKKTSIGLNESWGLDHGAWTVLKHIYPEADIPIVQMSLDYSQPPTHHYELARELLILRQKGVLIVGSGNMVHNLGMMDWQKMKVDDYSFEWAMEASVKMKKWILEDNHQPLIQYKSQGISLNLAIPTPEHFLPLLYTLALKDKSESIHLFNDKSVAGSIRMTSIRIG